MFYLFDVRVGEALPTRLYPLFLVCVLHLSPSSVLMIPAGTDVFCRRRDGGWTSDVSGTVGDDSVSQIESCGLRPDRTLSELVPRPSSLRHRQDPCRGSIRPVGRRTQDLRRWSTLFAERVVGRHSGPTTPHTRVALTLRSRYRDRTLTSSATTRLHLAGRLGKGHGLGSWDSFSSTGTRGPTS